MIFKDIESTLFKIALAFFVLFSSVAYAQASVQTVCNLAASVSIGNGAAVTGNWQVIQGTGSFADGTIKGTTVTGMSYGINRYQYIKTSDGSILEDETVYGYASYAGLDQTVCSNTPAQLNGVNPALVPGTSGVWSCISGNCGGVVITNTALYNTTVTGLLVGNTYTFRWTISGSTCGVTTDDVSVTVLAAPVANAGTDAAICIGNSTVLSASGGVSYSWAPTTGLNSSTIPGPTANPVTSTTYTVTVTDANGCTASDQVLVTVHALPIVSVSPNTTICPGNSSLLSASGGTSYLWNTGSTNSDITVSPATSSTYIVTVTDANLCSASGSVNVVVSPLPSVNFSGLPASACQNAASVTLTGNHAPSGSFTGLGIINLGNGTATFSPSGLIASSYNITYNYQDPATLCSSSKTQSVIVKAIPTFHAVNGGGAYCQGAAGVSIGIASPDAAINYELLLNGISTGLIKTNLTLPFANNTQTGTYTILATSQANSCSTSMLGSVSVSVNPLPDDAQVITGTNQVCAGTTHTYSVPTIANATNYVWQLPANVTITSGSGTSTITAYFGPLAASGTISVYGTNACGSGASSSYAVTVNPTPSAAGVITGDNKMCQGESSITYLVGSITNATGYTWTVPSGATITSGQGTSMINVDYGSSALSGNITVTGTNTCGSGTSSSLAVTLVAAPQLTLNKSPNKVTCNGIPVSLSATSTTANVTYSWAVTNGGHIVSLANPMQPTVDAAGDYIVTVTESSNSCTSIDQVTVLSDVQTPQGINITATNSSNLTCSVNQITLTATTTSPAPIGYSWVASGGGHIASGANTATPVVDAAGVFTVTVTSLANGCYATQSIVINDQKTLPNLSVINPATDYLNCTKTSVVLSASSSTSGVTFGWTGAGITANGTTANPTVNAAGMYTVTVLAPNGCTSSTVVQVLSDYSLPTVSVNSTPSQLNCTNAQVQLTGSSTTLGATLLWTGPGIVSGATMETPWVNQPGTYVLTVTHPTTGCTASKNVVVQKDISVPTILVNKTPNPITCLQPTVTLSGSSSTAGATLLWTGPGTITGPTTSTPIVNSAGNFTLTVTGTNGCTASDVVTVSQNIALPPIPNIVTGYITCTNPTVQITISPVIGNASYLWSTTSGGTIVNGNTAVATVDATGDYTVIATDLTNGCTRQNTATVTGDNTVPDAKIIGGPYQIDCSHQTLTLNGSTSTGGNPSWSALNGGHFVSGANTFTPVIDAGGTYVLTVTNVVSGCIQSVNIPVSIGADLPTISINAFPNKITCASPTVTLSGKPNEAGTTFAWSANPGHIVSGGATYNPVVDQAGTYLITVTRTSDLCTNNATIDVQADIAIPQLMVATPGKFNCAQSEVQLDASSTTPNVTYAWTTTPTGAIKAGYDNVSKPIVLKPASYTVTITDINNFCTNSFTAPVALDTVHPDISVNKNPGQLTCAIPSISLYGYSLTTGVNYLWTTTGSGNITGSTSQTPTIDGLGYYKLRVMNPVNGCKSYDSIQVIKDVAIPNIWVNTSPNQITCSSPTIQVQGNSTTANVTYAWSGPGTISDPSIKTPSVDAAGVYTLIVSSTINGCSASLPVTVTSNTAVPSAPVSSNASTCFGATVPTLTATGTNIKWYSALPAPASKLHDGSTFVPSAYTTTGSYLFFITQTDAVNGCESLSKQITYTVNSLPAAPGKTDAVICQGSVNPALLAVGTNIKWYDAPGGNLLTTGASYIPPATMSAAGTYTYYATQTNANSCESSTKSVLLTINAIPSKPTVNTASAQVCFGSANPAFIATGTTTKWYSNAALTTLVGAVATYTPVVAAVGTYNYYVTQTSASGCVSPSEVATLNINALPQLYAVTGGGAYCANTSGIAVGLAGSQTSSFYKLYLNGATLVTQLTGTGAAFDFGLQTGVGTYTVIAAGTNGCNLTMTGSKAIAANPLPSAIGTITGQSTVCQGTSSLTYLITPVANATTYVWTVPAGVTIVSGQNTNSLTVNYGAAAISGVISVVGQNACGSGTSASLNVTVVSSPNLTVNGSGGTLTCNLPSINLTCSSTTGGISYLWKATNGGVFASGANTTLQNVDVIAAGDYTITVAEPLNACKTSGTISVLLDKQTPQGIAITSTNAGVITCGIPQVTLTGSTTSLFPVSYSWTTASGGHIVSGSSLATPIVDKAGVYTVTITNTGNGCTSTTSISIIENKTVPVIAINKTPAQLNCITSKVQLSGSAVNSTLSWTGPAGATFTGGNTISTPQVDKPGHYVLTATGTNGCVSTDFVDVVQDVSLPLLVAITTPEVLTCTKTSTQLTGSSSTATATYSWSASNGGNITSLTTNPLVTLNAAGDYTLIVTHPTSYCTQTAITTVTQDLSTPVITFPAAPTTITCLVPTSSLSSTVTPIGSTLLWTGPGSISNNIINNPTVNTAGTYSLKATHSVTGCTSTRTVIVTDGRIQPSITIATPAQLTCTQPSVTIHSTTNIANYAALWTTVNGTISGANTNLDVVVTKAGTYTLEVTDQSNGCTSTQNITVTANQTAPDITLDKNPALLTCTVSQVTLFGSSATPSPSLQWTGPATAVITNPTSTQPKVNLAGTYTLTITGTNGCQSTDNVVVSEDKTVPVFPVIVTPANLTCSNSTVNLEVSPLPTNVDYLWSTTGAGIIINGATSIATVDAIGTYKITVTNRTSGCVNSNTVLVSENKTLPVPAITGGPYQVTCAQKTLVLDGSTSTGINPIWTSSLGGHIVSGGGLFKPTIDAAGTYTLTTTDATSGCTQSASVAVTASADLPVITFNAFPAKITCAVSTVILSGQPANGGDTYAWTASPGHIASGQASFNPVVDQSGNYTITVTSTSNGCVNTATIVVESDVTPPVLSIATPDQFSCTKSEVQLNAASSSPSVSYAWTTSGTGSVKVGNQNSQNPIVLTPGVYSVLLTNLANQCTSSANVTVTEDKAVPNINVDKNLLSLNCTRGEVSLGVNSVTSLATYLWTTSGSGNIVNATSTNPRVDHSGWYKATVTNPANGCTIADSVEVTSDIAMPNIWVDTNPAILNAVNTTVQIKGSSATANVSYLWIGPGTISDPLSKEPYVNAAGTYTLTVTSLTNGCYSSLAVTVTENTMVPAAPVGTGASICFGTAPAILHATGTNIKWYSDATLTVKLHDGNDFTPSAYTAINDYIFFITQTSAASHYESSATPILYSVKALPGAPVNTDMQICYGTANAALQAVGTNIRWYDMPGGTLLGTGNQYTPSVTISAVGTYTYYATQTDANTCEGSTVAVKLTINSIPAKPSVDKLSAAICSGIANPSFTASGNNLKWYSSTSLTTPIFTSGSYTPTVTAVGTYSYYVTQNISGCTSPSETVILTIHSLPQIFNVTGGGNYCENLNGVNVGVDNSEITSVYQLYLNTTTPVGTGVSGTGSDFNFGLMKTAGSYSVKATDANSCTSDQSGNATITISLIPAAAGTITGQSKICQGTLGVNYTVSPIANANSYVWVVPGGASITSGQGTNSITVDFGSSSTSGSISVLGQNSCGTGVASSFPVTVVANPQLTVNMMPGTITCTTPQLTLSASSTTSGISYLWNASNGGNIVSSNTIDHPTVNAAGDYLVTVTESVNSCYTQAKVTVPANVQIPQVVAISTTATQLTCIVPQAILTASTSSTFPVSYFWTASSGGAIVSGQGTSSIQVNKGGVYEVTITNLDNGCLTTKSTTITEQKILPDLSVTNPAANALSCSSTKVTLWSYSSTSGTIFSWSGPGMIVNAGTSTPDVYASGTYNVTVTAPNGCTSTSSVQVLSDYSVPTISVNTNPDQINCTHASISLSGSSTTTGALLNWTGPGVVSGPSSQTPVVNLPGLYTLTVTHPTTGCSNSAQVTVIQNTTLPTVTFPSIPQTITCTTPNVSIQGTTSASNPVYQWSTSNGTIVSGTTIDAVIVSKAGTYSLMVTDPANGCSASSSIVVSANQTAPGAQIAVPTLINCTNPTIDLSGSSSTSPVNILWTTSDGILVTGSSSFTPTVSQGGTYVMKITNPANGCISIASTTVSEDKEKPLISIDKNPSELNCRDIQVSLNGSATGATLQWTGLLGASIVNPTSATPLVNKAGRYYLTATTTNGCLAKDSTDVSGTYTKPANVTINVPVTLTCSQTTASLTGSSTTLLSAYKWSTVSGGNIVSSANSEIITVNGPGEYKMVVTHPTSFCKDSASVTVAQDLSAPVITIPTIPAAITCTATTSTLSSSVVPAISVLKWTGPGTISNDAISNPVVSAPGTYTLTATHPVTGCVTTRTVTVVDGRSTPDVSIATPGTLTCSQTSVVLSGSTAVSSYTAAWTTSNGAITAPANLLNAIVTKSGLYTLTVTDNTNGCQNSKNILVNADNTVPDITVDKNPAKLTCTISQVQLFGTSSTAGTNLVWSGPGTILNGTSSQPKVDAAGKFILTVTALNGCISKDTVTVVQDKVAPSVPVILAPSILTCSQTTADLEVSPLLVNVNYLWTTSGAGHIQNESTPIATVDAIGTYTLTVTDRNNGCTSQKSIVVSENKATPTATISGGPFEISCGTPSIQLDGSLSSGINPVWTSSLGGHIASGGNTFKPTVDGAGNYTLTITHATTGCIATATITVTASTGLPTYTIDAFPADLTCTTTSVTLYGKPNDVGSTFTWTASPGNIVSGGLSYNPVVDQPGTYVLEVTGTSGCKATASIIVKQRITSPVLTIATPVKFTCTNNLQVQLNASSTNASVSFAWSTSGTGSIKTGDENISNPQVLTPATYTVALTDLTNGCITTNSVVVSQDIISPDISIDKNPAPLTCSTKSVLLSGSSLTSGVTYRWTTTSGGNIGNPISTTPVVDAVGYYRLTVTNPVNGCKQTDSVLVTQDFAVPNVWVNTTPDTLNCANLLVKLSGNSSTSGVTFAWSGSGNITDATSKETTVDASGTYYFKVTTVSNGCSSSLPVQVQKNKTVLAAPLVTDAGVCYGSASGTLFATGVSGALIKWYSDASLQASVKLHEGTSFTPASATSANTYTYFVTQTSASSKCESNASQATYTVHALPLAPINIDNAICQGLTNPALQASGSNIKWYNAPAGSLLTTGATYTPPASVSSAGTYTFYASQTDGFGCESPLQPVVLTIWPTPNKPVVDKLSASTCYGTVSPSFTASGNDIQWYSSLTLPSAIKTGGTFTSSETVSGIYNYYVTQTSLYGCESPYEQIVYTIKPLPQKFTVTGGGIYCADLTGLQVGLNGSDATTSYQLLLNGTTAITSTFGTGAAFDFGLQKTAGNYSVLASGANGCTTMMTGGVSISINPLPGVAGTVSGLSSVCQEAAGVAYQIPSITNATSYVWDVPSGVNITSGLNSNSIQVTFGSLATTGSFRVYGTNACGNGTISADYQVVVNQLPTAAGSIIYSTGNNSICPGTSNYIYEVAPISYATSYEWNLPAGMTIVAGANTSQIKVRFATTMIPGLYTIKARGKNLCGTGAWSALYNITVNSNPVVYAGIDQNVCASSATLTGSTIPSSGTASWNIVSGSATIANSSAAITGISMLAQGENVFVYTIDANGCQASDSIKIINNSLYVEAGQSLPICSFTLTLQGSTPPAGTTGIWSVVTGSASFVTASNPVTNATGFGYGDTKLYWTVSKNGCDSRDSVIITNYSPSTPDAGPDQAICINSTTLKAKQPVYGTGKWQLFSGSAVFSDVNDPNTIITSVAKDKNVFVWKITHHICSLSDTLVITNNAVDVSAGYDQIICENRTDMNGNPPLTGTTGQWSVLQGSASFLNSKIYNTKVSGLITGTNILMWGITKGSCISTDTMMITCNTPTIASAGLDQYIPSGTTVLAGNKPLIGKGKWSVINGQALFANDTLFNTQVDNLNPGANVLRWSITYNGCVLNDEVTITNGTIEAVSAGADQTLCTSETYMEATSPQYGFGTWTVLKGSANFEDNEQYNTRAYNLLPGKNVLRWAVTVNGVQLADTVIIINNQPTTALTGPQQYLCIDSSALTGNLVIEGGGYWTLEGGSAVFSDQTLNNSKVTKLGSGDNTFRWTITKGTCSSSVLLVITNNKPSDAQAGADQTICDNTLILTPVAPSVGTGEWSVLSGSGTFAGNSVTGLATGLNTLRYTISKGNCKSHDDVQITSYKPTTSSAGQNEVVCINSTTLSANKANTATGEYGRWSVMNGAGTFVDTTSNATTITDLALGKNVLRWTINNHGCLSYGNVEVYYGFEQADAGQAIVTCDNFVTLGANTPMLGNGEWSVIGGSGSAVFTSSSSSNTVVKNLDKGVNLLRWTIRNQTCVSYSDVSITNNSPSDAFAGGDQSLCSITTTLSARQPAVGTGSWSVLSGSGSFVTSSAFNTTVFNIGSGSNTYRWTVKNGNCTSIDEVVISNNKPISTSAGTDQTICADSALLAANYPAVGAGVWSITKGSGSFKNIYDPNTTVYTLANDTSVLRWLVTNKSCSEYQEIKIINNLPSVAKAGTDKTLCTTSVTLDGNPPKYGSGEWSVNSGGGTFVNKTRYNTVVSDLLQGANTLRWTITKYGCTSYDDVVFINDLPTAPIAGSTIEVCDNKANLNANESLIGTGHWDIISGSGKFADSLQYDTQITNLGQGSNILRWTTINNSCSLFDLVEVINDQTTVYAGPDQTVYADSAMLTGNNPTRGMGTWSLEAGSGAIVSVNNSESLVNSLSEGANTFMWSVNINSCISTDRVLITYIRRPEALFAVNLSAGCSPLEVKFTKTSVDNFSFYWDFGNNDTTSAIDPTYIYTQPGIYNARLIVNGPNGMQSVLSKVITVYELPVAKFDLSPVNLYLPDDQLHCFNYSEKAVSYQWSFGDGSTSTELNPLHLYTDSGYYSVSLNVTSANQCVDSLTKDNVVHAIEKSRLLFPNAFTPNTYGSSDGKYNRDDYSNDVFYPIVMVGDLKEYTLEIFNRWGVLLFRSKQIDVGWDGYYKGKLLMQDVYVYRVSGVYNDGKRFSTIGDVLLLVK